MSLIVPDDPFVIKDDCNDATSRWSMRDTTHSQFSPIDPVTLDAALFFSTSFDDAMVMLKEDWPKHLCECEGK